MKPTYNVAAAAHAKIVLHACKFPTNPVNGVLLGREVGDNVEIVDVVPFFHTHIGLPLRLEIALAQVCVTGLCDAPSLSPLMPYRFLRAISMPEKMDCAWLGTTRQPSIWH